MTISVPMEKGEPTMKDKLIELMFEGALLADANCDKQTECEKCQYNAPNGCRWGAIADHLIANGVTVQKWIPVTERLPNKNEDVLCYRDGHIGELMDVYTYVDDKYWEDSYGYLCRAEDEGITHWMSLPELPQGE